MIKDLIKADLISARKNKDTVTVTSLSTLLGELERVDANKLTPELEINIIKKYLENLAQSAHISDEAGFEYLLIQGYLPTQLSENETKAIINNLEDKSIPAVMKHFNTNHVGTHDKKLISSILKSL